MILSIISLVVSFMSLGVAIWVSKEEERKYQYRKKRRSEMEGEK